LNRHLTRRRRPGWPLIQVAIQRLHPVGLTKRRSHGRVVEGTDNPLRSTLPDPVGGPKRVQTSVEDEYRIGLGQITQRSGHRLRMDAIQRTARRRLSNGKSTFIGPISAMIVAGGMWPTQRSGPSWSLNEAQRGSFTEALAGHCAFSDHLGNVGLMVRRESCAQRLGQALAASGARHQRNPGHRRELSQSRRARQTICSLRDFLGLTPTGLQRGRPRHTTHAQQTGKLPTIGFFSIGSAAAVSSWVDALVQRLKELGWIEGRTIAIEIHERLIHTRQQTRCPCHVVSVLRKYFK
jgi:hypothetical protein